MSILKDRRGKALLAVAAALALAAIACGPTAQPTAAPTAVPTAVVPTAVPPTQPPAAQASLTVVNQTGGVICYLYVSPTTSDSWGEDQLGESNVIDSGASFTLNLSAGNYDLRAEDCNGNMLAEEYGVTLGTFTWTVGSTAARPGGTLTITNNTTTTVCYIYISEVGSDQWGPDQLGAGNTIPAGTSFDITDIPAGTYDLKAADCDNVTLAEQYGVTLSGGDFTWTLSMNTAQLIVLNNSSQDICYLYLSPTDSDTWGPDQLGSQTIPAGQQFTLTGITPGVYDLRAESCSGGELEAEDLNITGTFTYEITN